MRHNRQKQVDADLYSTHILEELLDSHKDWENVEDIVPLTFKAVVDMLSVHSQALKDIKAVLTTRASKTELTTGLAIKSNVSDVSKAVQELSQALDQRPTLTDLNSTLRQFATKSDLNDLLVITQTNRHMASSLDQRQNMELTILKTRMDEFQREITKKVGACATLREFGQLTSILQGKANMSQINEVLEQKVNKQYLVTALQKKANKSDVDALLMKKADTADLEYIVNGLESKVSVGTLDKLTQVIDNKVDKSQLAIHNNQRNSHNRSHLRQQEEDFIEKLEIVKNSMSLELKEVRKGLELEIKESQGLFQLFRREFDVQMRKFMTQTEADINKKQAKLKSQTNEQNDALKQALRSVQDDFNNKSKALASLSGQLSQRKRGQQNIYSEIDDVRKKLQESVCKMANQRDFIDFRSEITSMMEGKIELEEVQRALDNFEATINVRLAGDRTQHLQQIRSLKDLLSHSAQTSSAQIQELRRTLFKKQERGQTMTTEEVMRKMRKQIEECRKTVDLIYNQVRTKLSLKEYQTDLVQIRKRFEGIAKEIKNKANISDVCVLADSKPNIEDVNQALREINQALGGKVSETDLQSILKDLNSIHETLCTENIVGRWMWHSGQVKSGSIIPWESESANTVPDYFFWQKDKTSILILTAGVYEVTACIFSKGATMTIMANGEVINPVKNEQNQNNMNSKIRRKKDKGLGSNCIKEFLLLPARSRISITCHGEGSQGFLNIRRF